MNRYYSLLNWNLPCFILGSAPNPRMAGFQSDKMNLICVNSSGWSAKQEGLRPSDLTVLSAIKLFRPDKAVDREAMKDLETRILLFVTYGLEIYKATLKDAKNILSQLNYRYDRFECIGYTKRARIVASVTGKNLGKGAPTKTKVSNGIFAVCLALYYGSPLVIVSGISLTSGGYNYTDIMRKRGNIIPDKAAISAIRTRKLPLKTSEPELARTTGIDLV